MHWGYWRLGAIIAIICATGIVSSCRKKKAPVVSRLPAPVSTVGDATPANRWGPDRTVNLETQTLFIQLDYMPEQEIGTAAIPTCFDWLPDEFVLGYAFCPGSDEKREVHAKSVRQSCLAREESKDPSEKINLDCKLADVFTYQFDPNLTVGVSGPTTR